MAKKYEEKQAVIDDNKAVLLNAYNSGTKRTGTGSAVQPATTGSTAVASAVDPTQQAAAASASDVQAQDAKTRLWQSLENSYDQQRQQSNESYDQAISQADRQMLSRGMGRSSYAGQTLANMQQKKIEAENQITGNQIADYQNRLTQLEQQELENERWERQFNYQQSRDTVADEQWQKQFNAQQEQWKQQFEYNKKTADQQMAYNYVVQMLEKGDRPSDELLKRAGISRHDYNQMKTSMKASGGGSGGKKSGVPTWQQLGFNSEADYNAWLAGQGNGQSPNAGTAGSTLALVNGFNSSGTDETKKRGTTTSSGLNSSRYHTVK